MSHQCYVPRDGDLGKLCLQPTVWRDMCAEHCGPIPSLKSLAELLGRVNGYHVHGVFKIGTEVRNLDMVNRITWSCSVDILGAKDMTATGHGASIEMAMFNCAEMVVRLHERVERWHRIRHEDAASAVLSFNKEHELRQELK